MATLAGLQAIERAGVDRILAEHGPVVEGRPVVSALHFAGGAVAVGLIDGRVVPPLRARDVLRLAAGVGAGAELVAEAVRVVVVYALVREQARAVGDPAAVVRMPPCAHRSDAESHPGEASYDFPLNRYLVPEEVCLWGLKWRGRVNTVED